uniref:Uncharacterized protein n=1 Tax=Helianthus annuus TaxID=4232 RepID=A0A251RSE8_HELAN
MIKRPFFGQKLECSWLMEAPCFCLITFNVVLLFSVRLFECFSFLLFVILNLATMLYHWN